MNENKNEFFRKLVIFEGLSPVMSYKIIVETDASFTENERINTVEFIGA